MKRLLLLLFALIPLAGCASSGGGYASGGGAYFYGDCLYLENCYDGYYRNEYYSYGNPTVPVSPYERQRVERLTRRASARVVPPRGDGSNSRSFSGAAATFDRSISGASSFSRSPTTVGPRGNPAPASHSAPAPAPAVSHSSPKS